MFTKQVNIPVDPSQRQVIPNLL